MQELISVIVPVYRTEQFIEKCILSLCNQTLEQFEMIIVDDCSPDNAIKIVENVLSHYPLRKEKTKIISLEKNQGLPNARKVGLENATGKYIISVDSDDYLELDALTLMLNKIQETDADILVCDYFVTTKKNDFYMKQEAPESAEDYLKKLLTLELYPIYWNKLYKKSLLDRVHIFTDIHHGEDGLVAIQMALISSKIAYLPKAFLHYVQYNPNAMTKNHTDKSISDLFFSIGWFEEELKKRGKYEFFSQHFLYRKYITKLGVITFSNKEKRREYFSLYDNELLDYEPIIKVSLYKKVFMWLVNKRYYAAVDFILLIRKLKWLVFHKFF